MWGVYLKGFTGGPPKTETPNNDDSCKESWLSTQGRSRLHRKTGPNRCLQPGRLEGDLFFESSLGLFRVESRGS